MAYEAGMHVQEEPVILVFDLSKFILKSYTKCVTYFHRDELLQGYRM